MPVFPLSEPRHQSLKTLSSTAITSPFLNSSSPGSEGTKSKRARTRDTVAAVVPVGVGCTGAAWLAPAWADGPALARPEPEGPACDEDGAFLRSSSCRLSLRAI